MSRALFDLRTGERVLEATRFVERLPADTTTDRRAPWRVEEGKWFFIQGSQQDGLNQRWTYTLREAIKPRDGLDGWEESSVAPAVLGFNPSEINNGPLLEGDDPISPLANGSLVFAGRRRKEWWILVSGVGAAAAGLDLPPGQGVFKSLTLLTDAAFPAANNIGWEYTRAVALNP